MKNKAVYQDLKQEQGRETEGGYIRIQFLIDDDEQKLDEERCKNVEQIINEALAKGYGKSDIAILTRSNRSGSLIASYLLQHQIPVISSESLLIDNSPAVKLILFTLTYFDNPGNYLVRATLFYHLHAWLMKKKLRFDEFDFKTDQSQFEQTVSLLLDKQFQSCDFLIPDIRELIAEIIGFYPAQGQ